MDDLPAAHLDRADLTDAVVLGRSTGGLDIEHAERHIDERGAEIVEAALAGGGDNSGRWHGRRYAGAVTSPRYRCTNCGNLTRFDVTTTRTVRAFHHYSVGGELAVEEPEVLAETVDAVACRWCGTGAGVEELPGE